MNFKTVWNFNLCINNGIKPIETVDGDVFEDGISGSLFSTGSFGHIEVHQTLSASLGVSASLDH